ncbi:molybdopterin-guanine dinucleotide biosynthesis protein A, proteobacterial [Hoeflea phototrophica DFL-43]|jgi:molybdopterin-guanine dinucleotide biosynthesis protein A|uniref:Molybdenum cofactor guanylyltransferase n=1 Tax=Hoeflea phototrophica (strain DSM 17068 / NCIMB 14078 / DFL-43) TaxID=411684 RepID=A9D6S4_HOEPD|nr:molybdenum cofactor guanylyltransferase MobA [Hoeflea phototrophica]EDQ33583.1 molybdopterin-guanine dinucleotide biosynthesis protein A, proteobacterial [Hoeflea phototrophica DFL-43]
MNIIGGILAGGRGRRMEGIDKPFAELDGKPLIAHVIRRMTPQAGEVIINANGEAERFDQFGFDVIADRIDGFRGPLAGLHALMVAAGERGGSHLLSVPADTPFLPADLATRLTSVENTDGAARIASSKGRRQPVVALWPVDLAKGLEAYLSKTGDLSMAAYLRQIETTETGFPVIDGLDPFFNINTPGDLEQAERLIAACPDSSIV